MRTPLETFCVSKKSRIKQNVMWVSIIILIIIIIVFSAWVRVSVVDKARLIYTLSSVL